MRWTRRRALVGLCLLLAAGCTVKYVRFPIGEFLTEYIAIRDEFRDETYPARKRCARETRPTLLPAKALQCDALQLRLDAWARRDVVTLKAIIEGGTIDLAAFRDFLGPIVKLAADIAL